MLGLVNKRYSYYLFKVLTNNLWRTTLKTISDNIPVYICGISKTTVNNFCIYQKTKKMLELGLFKWTKNTI